MRQICSCTFRSAVDTFLSTAQLCYSSMIDIRSGLLTPHNSFTGAECARRCVSYFIQRRIYVRSRGHVRANTCGMMMAGWPSTGQYRLPVAKWGTPMMAAMPSTLIFLWKRVQMVVSIVRGVGACQGCQRRTAWDMRSVCLSLSSPLASYYPSLSMRC